MVSQTCTFSYGYNSTSASMNFFNTVTDVSALIFPHRERYSAGISLSFVVSLGARCPDGDTEGIAPLTKMMTSYFFFRSPAFIYPG